MRLCFAAFLFVGLISAALSADGKQGWLSNLSDKILSVFSSSRSKESRSSILSQSAIEQKLLEARNMVVDGNLENAVDHLIPILEHQPNHQDTNAIIGAILLGVQQFKMAEEFLYRAVNGSNWKNSAAVANLAQVFLHDNAIELAIKTLRRGLVAVDNNDESGTLSLSFGDVAIANRQYEEAANWYLSAAIKKPASVDVWIKASTIRYPPDGRNLKLAENVLVQAMAANKESVERSTELLFHMGLVIHARGDVEDAVTFYEQSIRSGYSNKVEAISTLATAYHSLGRQEEALAQYRAAEAVEESTNPIFLANYALLLHSIGHKQEAIARVERALKLDPECQDAHRARDAIARDQLKRIVDLNSKCGT